jgi:hypothetical protein
MPCGLVDRYQRFEEPAGSTFKAKKSTVKKVPRIKGEEWGLANINEPICMKNGVENTDPQVSILFQMQSESNKRHKVN